MLSCNAFADACAVSAQLLLRAQVLNKARDDAGKQAQTSLRDTNNVVRMVTAGSKGSFINISQVRARQLARRWCVWQLLPGCVIKDQTRCSSACQDQVSGDGGCESRYNVEH